MPTPTPNKPKRLPIGERLLSALEEVRDHLDGKLTGCTVVSPPSWSRCIVELHRCRLSDGLSQAEIGKRSGLRIKTVSMLELGKIATQP